ncbi:MAG TPA: hypothetical protein VHO70_10210 [Chitinispirillaceae bacterium]|nr:hypothetical protein [Chitinispirillaceae bacterium]
MYIHEVRAGMTSATIRQVEPFHAPTHWVDFRNDFGINASMFATH